MRVLVTAHMRSAARRPIPLAWGSDVEDIVAIEVYPAATLRSRNLHTAGCGRPDSLEARRRIATSVSEQLPNLVEKIAAPSHEFDAALCLLAAFDFVCGPAVPPRAECMERVVQEGWIWVKVPG